MIPYRELNGTLRGSGRTLWCRLFHGRYLSFYVIDIHGSDRDVIHCRICDQYDVPRWGSRVERLGTGPVKL